jgi:tol-pal system protein YbgF
MKLKIFVLTGLLSAGCLVQAAQPLPPVIESSRGRVVESTTVGGIPASSNVMLEMHRQIERLKREVQQVRGELEELTYNMDGVKKRQRDIYLDLDRRLQPLERGEGAVTGDVALPSKPQQAASIAVEGGATHSPSKVVKQHSTNLVEERKAYQQAFNTLKEGRYSQSIKQFKAFLNDYPSGEYADNATYWLAETYYVTRAFPEARGEFEKLAVSFPESQKIPDALLKQGYIAYELKNWKTARKKLSEVVSRFPNSSAARLAENRLLRMKQEKH